jgi:hypothetical protein
MDKKAKKQQNVKVSKAPASKKTELLDRLENYFSHRARFYMLLCVSTALIFALLLFDVNITEAADDSTYIESGYRYATDFFNYHYIASAPLYCMFLALPIAIFGLNIVILKMFSVLFFVLGIYLMYVALKDRIQYIILFPALLLTALNSLYLYYASQTFTEAFILPLSGLFLWRLFKLDDATNAGADLKMNWKKFLLLGFVTCVFYLARNVATIAIVVVIVYFISYRKYLTALYSVCSFVLFWGLYHKVIVPLFWGHLNISGGMTGQVGSIFLKNTYNPAEGIEDFMGMVVRFFTNAKTYSAQFFEIIGLKPVTNVHGYVFFIILAVLVGISFGYAIAKKQRYVVALILYVTAFLCVTFISLATFWRQARLIMVYLPMIISIILYLIVMLLKTKPAKLLRWMYPAVVVILVLVNLNNTTDKIGEHFPTLRKNIAGNKYAGFTPDWVNYFLVSEWAAKNLDKDKAIVCRKASMSFIYTGRQFSGINNVPTVLSDSVLLASNYNHHFVGIESKYANSQIHTLLHDDLIALIIEDNRYYYIYDIPTSRYELLTTAFNIPTYTNPDELLAVVQRAKKHYGVYPDRLLEMLKDWNAGYIIDARLRTNPARNTGSVINTISRYMNFIRQKYPSTFRQIYQVGTNENEPAMVYEIHYPPIDSK